MEGAGCCVPPPPPFSPPLRSAQVGGPGGAQRSPLSQPRCRQGLGGTGDLVGICGLAMTNASLSVAHHCVYQPGASERLGANRLSVVSDLSWSLARREAPCLQAPAGVRRRGVLPAGPADPSGTPSRAAPICTGHC